MSKEYLMALRVLGLVIGVLGLVFGLDPWLLWLSLTLPPAPLAIPFTTVYVYWLLIMVLASTGLLLHYLLKDRPEQRVR